MGEITFPSDNDFEIPTLDIQKQAPGVIGKFRIWGKQARKRPYCGDTFSFYGNDSSFTALIKHPEGIPKSQAAVIVEPNFSTNDQMAWVDGLHKIYLKRKLACYAQIHDQLVIVDLTVSPKFQEANLIGVPRGWKSYCCRATKQYGPDFLMDNYTLAQEHARSTQIIYIVYGGGKATTDYVRGNHWIHIPEYMQTVMEEGS